MRRSPWHQQEIPAPPVSSASSSRKVIVPSSTKNASEQFTCRCGGGVRAPAHGALHEREVAAGLVRDGLERHHVPARGEQMALSRWHDAGHGAYSAWVSDTVRTAADAVAELYEADPDGFTERRAELAAAARDAGERAAAKQITALRKPTRWPGW